MFALSSDDSPVTFSLTPTGDKILLALKPTSKIDGYLESLFGSLDVQLSWIVKIISLYSSFVFKQDGVLQDADVEVIHKAYCSLDGNSGTEFQATLDALARLILYGVLKKSFWISHPLLQAKAKETILEDQKKRIMKILKLEHHPGVTRRNSDLCKNVSRGEERDFSKENPKSKSERSLSRGKSAQNLSRDKSA